MVQYLVSWIVSKCPHHWPMAGMPICCMKDRTTKPTVLPESERTSTWWTALGLWIETMKMGWRTFLILRKSMMSSFLEGSWREKCLMVGKASLEGGLSWEPEPAFLPRRPFPCGGSCPCPAPRRLESRSPSWGGFLLKWPLPSRPLGVLSDL